MSVWILGLLASVLIHECTRLDFWVQDFFYDQSTGLWWIAARDALPRFCFYLLPKWTMIALTIALAAWVASDRLRKRHRTRNWHARLALLICLVAVPLIVGLIKRYSGVWCPAELTRYGGDHAFRLLFQSRPVGQKIGHCFPAGHASAGFAFLALYFLPASKRAQLKFGAIGMAIGWIMGLYQMFKGAHFLTHTTTTMCIAGIIVLTAGQCLKLPAANEAE